MSKVLCLISHSQCPPNGCKMALCTIFCAGGRPEVPLLMTPEQAETISYFQDTAWLFYCCCWGLGFTSCADPLVRGRQKFCCVENTLESAEPCGDEGCSFHASKLCCLASYSQCPPQMTPGVGCCNFLRVGNLPEGPAQPPQQMAMP